MPIGVIVNVLAVAVGGVIGALFGNKMSKEFKDSMTMIFGVCALGMGVSSVGLMENMPAVIFSVIIGTGLGLICHIGVWIQKGGELLQIPVAKLFKNSAKEMPQDEYMSALITIIVLFCASGTGIYGCIDSGMTGNHTILISKAILDVVTSMIFACNLGIVVSFVAIPQLVIFLLMFFAANAIYPLTTPTMINDFKACGGFLLLATGFRMMKVKELPVADMIPAMILIMPVSWAWVNWIMPIL